MRTTRLAAGAVATLAVIAGLSGCSKDNEDHSAHASSTTAAPTTAAPTKLTGSSAAPLPPPSPTHPPQPALEDVNCGPVTGGNGAAADVIVFASAAGRAGCTEAINVVSDYLGVPRTGDAVAVDGWTCEPQPDPAVKHICVNQGLTIGLRGDAAPATPKPPAPTTIRTVDPTKPPIPTTTSSVPPVPPPVVDDVNCGPVTDAGGATRTVIAVGTADGRPGCTEAINVATTYVTTIAPSDSVEVQGWQCNSQPDTQFPQVCSKDGLVIALRAN